MSNIRSYVFNDNELQDFLDKMKILVISNIVQNDFLDAKLMDIYSANTGIIIKPKSIFRTISDLFSKREEKADSSIFSVVQSKPITGDFYSCKYCKYKDEIDETVMKDKITRKEYDTWVCLNETAIGKANAKAHPEFACKYFKLDDKTYDNFKEKTLNEKVGNGKKCIE